MNRDDPLTPEERALAGLMGRRHDQTPPAALDAAILAAARASVATAADDTPAAAAPVTAPARHARRPRSRWPAVFGIAASMVFAVGIAWQMRPEPPVVPAQAAQVAAAPMADDTAVADSHAPQPAPVAAEAAPPPPPPPPTPAPQKPAAARAMAATPAAARAPEVQTAQGAAEPAPRSAAPRLPAAPAAEAMSAPPPPAAPSPPSPAAYAAPAPATVERDILEGVRETSTATNVPASGDAARSQRRAPPATFKADSTRAPTGAPGVMLRRSSDAGLSAETVHSEVAADAMLPRRQWLQKIRERRDDGQRDLARASLERYLQLYPEARLPKDLRPLLDD
ncbi:hypothetical protein [Stenotrophomonas sp. NPDC077659]|uniref:hypothetical protein n=1 Tax=Stenotrophomonas sp. NPDC077659 TaxID=3390694 RepID=UPI003D03192C